MTILGLVGFLWLHTSAELAPEEDQGIVFAVTKAPKYANIDYIDYYGAKLDKVFASFPETDLRFVLNGINGPQNGIAGMLLTPWDQRRRSSIKLKPLVQAALSRIEGVNAFAFNLPPLPGTPPGDRFSERRIGLDHIAIGVSSRAELQRLTDALHRNGIAPDLHHDPMGPAVVTFRDPDNIQWEFFEQA